MAQGQVTHAATFTVTNANDSGAGSLRQAILDANASPGADTIDFGLSGCPCTIALTGGELAISDDLTITGPGESSLAVDGSQTSRVFNVASGVRVNISDLTIQNGLASEGGGIFNVGALTLSHSTVNRNRAGFGGGIFNYQGTVTLGNSAISDNSSTGFGGGILNVGGTMTLSNSTVSRNSSGTHGAGIVNNVGTMTLTGSTVSGNNSDISGGGIENASSFGEPSRSTMMLTNCTVSGNSSRFSPGGGIVNSGALTLTNCTVSGNSAYYGGGGIHNETGSVTLSNSIVANQIARSDCFLAGGTIISSGYNLDSDNTCGLTDPTDIPHAHANLGPLQDNGGPTFTRALLPGSDAIDHGSPDCPLPATDQRGFARPVDGDGDGTATCDIGAYEFGATGTVTVAIDVKPESFPNSINPRSKGVIAVAILTTDSFDATTVNVSTVLFGATGTEAVPVGVAFEDVDLDGDTDLILHFHTQQTGILCGGTSASLTGQTFSGQMIQGSDSVKTVGCK